MSKKKDSAEKKAKSPSAAEQAGATQEAAAPTQAEPTAETKAPSTDDVDSLGETKDGTPIGPVKRTGKGAKVVIPVGLKADPAEKTPPSTNTVTDKVDSAGTEISDEHSYVPGPRGPHAARFVKDSYRS